MSEWGPWIEHDGMPAPDAHGKFCNVISADGRDECGIVRNALAVTGKRSVFLWHTLRPHDFGSRVIRYRIRKPLGLTILEGVLADLPVKVDA